MPTTEERLASLEARMDRINDLFTLVAELRAEMHHGFGTLDAKLDGKTDSLRVEMHQHFRWIVGIQLTTMAAIVAALITVLGR